MSLLNRLTGGRIGSEDSDDEPAPEFDEDFNVQMEEEEGEMGGEVEETQEQEEEPEWDSAYDFAEWYLEDEGFSSMLDFGQKAAMARIESSPMYRDRIQSGMQTLSMIEQATEQMRTIKGQGGEEKSWSEKADDLRAANEVVGQIQTLEGQEEMIIQQGFKLAEDAIGAYKERGGQVQGDVNASMEETGESL